MSTGNSMITPRDWSLSDQCESGGVVNLSVDAECHVADATARIVRMDLGGPREDLFLREDSFWLDMSLTPRVRDARARFVDHWRPDRFQHVGAVFVFPPGEALQIRSQAGIQSSLICQLQRDLISKWMGQEFNSNNIQFEDVLSVANGDIKDALRRLVL